MTPRFVHLTFLCRFKPLTLSKENWLGALRLATVWDMPEVSDGKPHGRAPDECGSQIRAFAIKSISTWLEPLEKVRFGKELRVKEWFLEGCISLTSPGKRQQVETLAKTLGWELAAKVLDACQRASEKTRLTPIKIPPSGFRCYSCVRAGIQSANEDAIHVVSRRLQRYELVLDAIPIPGEWNQSWSCGNCQKSGSQLPNGTKLTIHMSELVAFAAEDATDIVREVFKRELGELED